MTARRQPQGQNGRDEQSRPSTLGVGDRKEIAATHAVMSVSPDAAESTVSVAPPVMTNEPDTTRIFESKPHEATPVSDNRESIFLTPRVIDQQAYNELSATLNALVSRAETYATSLAETLEQATTDETQVAEASQQLEERLKLGARMLKAFQSQIAAVESSMGELSDHHEQVTTAAQRIGDIETRLAQTIEQFDAHVRSSIDHAQSKMETMADQADDSIVDTAAELLAKLEPYKLTEHRLSELMERAQSVCHDVEQAEVSTAALMKRQGEVEAAAQQSIAQLEDLVNTGSHQLDEQAAAITEHVDESITRATQAIDAHLERVDGTNANILDQIARGEAVVADIHAACASVENRLTEITERAEEKITSATDQVELWLNSMVEKARQDIEAAATDAISRTREQCTALPVEIVEESTPTDPPVPTPQADEVKAMPEFINRMLDDLRKGIGEDMARLSSEVNNVADRVASLSGAPAASPAQPVAKPDPIDIEPPGVEETNDEDEDHPQWYRRHMEGA